MFSAQRAAMSGYCQLMPLTNELTAESRAWPAGSPCSQLAAPLGSFWPHSRATVSSALLRRLPSGKVAAQVAADCGSDDVHTETTASAALFWPSPAGRLATKFAASRGDCCAQLEVMAR